MTLRHLHNLFVILHIKAAGVDRPFSHTLTNVYFRTFACSPAACVCMCVCEIHISFLDLCHLALVACCLTGPFALFQKLEGNYRELQGLNREARSASVDSSRGREYIWLLLSAAQWCMMASSVASQQEDAWFVSRCSGFHPQSKDPKVMDGLLF